MASFSGHSSMGMRPPTLRQEARPVKNVDSNAMPNIHATCSNFCLKTRQEHGDWASRLEGHITRHLAWIEQAMGIDLRLEGQLVTRHALVA